MNAINPIPPTHLNNPANAVNPWILHCPSTFHTNFKTWFSATGRKICLGLNGLAVRATDAITLGFCTIVRSGSNGPPPGPPSQKSGEKNLNFWGHVWNFLGCSFLPVRIFSSFVSVLGLCRNHLVTAETTTVSSRSPTLKSGIVGTTYLINALGPFRPLGPSDYSDLSHNPFNPSIGLLDFLGYIGYL